MSLTYKDVAEILKIIDASDCEEVILELQGLKLAVRRGGAAGSAGAIVGSAPAPQSAAAPLAAPPAASPPPAPAAKAPSGAALAAGHVGVRAPMVGTFYRRPSPQEPTFVEVGSRIKKGAPLCLIEVMKLYTTIESPADGIVEAIHAEDGKLVEFDQLIIAIRPA